MSIKQFNGTYDQQQDRVLLRFNTQEGTEFRLWITRFMANNILLAIDQLIQKALERKHDSKTAAIIHEFQDEGLQKTTNLRQRYDGAQSFPLGDQPILLVGFSASEKDGTFSFEWKLIGGKSLNINLPTKAIQSLGLLIKSLGQEHAKWGLNQPLEISFSAPETKLLSSEKLIH